MSIKRKEKREKKKKKGEGNIKCDEMKKDCLAEYKNLATLYRRVNERGNCKHKQDSLALRSTTTLQS